MVYAVSKLTSDGSLDCDEADFSGINALTWSKLGREHP